MAKSTAVVLAAAAVALAAAPACDHSTLRPTTAGGTGGSEQAGQNDAGSGSGGSGTGVAGTGGAGTTVGSGGHGGAGGARVCATPAPPEGCVGFCTDADPLQYLCVNGAWVCPDRTFPAEGCSCAARPSQPSCPMGTGGAGGQGGGAIDCVGAAPSDGCVGASDGVCYEDSLSYQCVGGVWTCPAGTFPASSCRCDGGTPRALYCPPADAGVGGAAGTCRTAGDCAANEHCFIVNGGPAPPCFDRADGGACPSGTQLGCPTGRPDQCVQVSDAVGTCRSLNGCLSNDPCKCLCTAPSLGGGCFVTSGVVTCSYP